MDNQDSNLDENNSVAQALTNPVILHEIFKNQTVNGKDVRRVCRLWNDIILCLPKLSLNLYANKFMYPTEEPFYNNFEPQLGKKVRIDEANCDIKGLSSKDVLIRACDKFDQHLTYLDLVFINAALVEAFYKILLGDNHCQVLKRMRIAKTIEFDDDGRPFSSSTTHQRDSAVEPLPTRTNLRSIYIRVHQLSTTSSFCLFSQLLIDSAPNLKRLELSSHHYFPDLSKSSNLSVLLIPRGPELRKVKGDEFSRMLQQVANSLEVILIGCKDSMFPDAAYDVGEEIIKADFNLPKMMPQLKTFRNEYLDVFKCGNALQDICGKKCPNLRHLIFGNYSFVDVFLERMNENGITFSFGNVGVTSLSLEWIKYPTSFRCIKNCFPYLKRLEILAWFEVSTLGPLFQACSTLSLTHLNVTLKDYPETLSEFVECFLNSEELFNTLRVLTITRKETSNCVNGRDDLMSNPEGMNLMKQMVLSLTRMERAVIWYPICKEAWDRILPYIKDNNIALEFKGW